MIKTTNTYPQYVNFGNGFRTGFAQRSVLWWVYLISSAPSEIHGPVWIIGNEIVYSYFSTASGGSPDGHLALVADWSGSNPLWRTNAAYNNVGQWMRFGWSYDNTSTANDPIIYYNGQSVAITEAIAPAGSYGVGDETQNFGFGGWGGPTINGYQDGFCLYDRILTPAEFALDYAMRKNVVITKGLRWAPYLNGARGRQSFNNLTLSEADLLIDPVSGATGIPKNFATPNTGAFPIGFGSEIARGEFP